MRIRRLRFSFPISLSVPFPSFLFFALWNYMAQPNSVVPDDLNSISLSSLFVFCLSARHRPARCVFRSLLFPLPPLPELSLPSSFLLTVTGRVFRDRLLRYRIKRTPPCCVIFFFPFFSLKCFNTSALFYFCFSAFFFPPVLSSFCNSLQS